MGSLALELSGHGTERGLRETVEEMVFCERDKGGSKPWKKIYVKDICQNLLAISKAFQNLVSLSCSIGEGKVIWGSSGSIVGLLDL